MQIGDQIADAGFVGRVLRRAAANAKFHRNQRHGRVLHEPGLDAAGRNQMLDLGGGAARAPTSRRHCQASGNKEPNAPRARSG